MENITTDTIIKVLQPFHFAELEIMPRGGKYWLYIHNIGSYSYTKKEWDEEHRSAIDVSTSREVHNSLYVRGDSLHELLKKIIETDVEQVVESEYKENSESFWDLDYHCKEIERLCKEWGDTLNCVIGKVKEFINVSEYNELHDYDFLKDNGTLLAKYNYYYPNTDIVDKGIEWYLIFGKTYQYDPDRNTAYPDGCLDEYQAGDDVNYDGYPLVDCDYGYWEKQYDFDKDELHICP